MLHICIEYCCGNTLADLIQENVTEKKSDEIIKTTFITNFYGAGTYPCSKNHSSRHETSKYFADW